MPPNQSKMDVAENCNCSVVSIMSLVSSHSSFTFSDGWMDLHIKIPVQTRHTYQRHGEDHFFVQAEGDLSVGLVVKIQNGT